jgi:glycosyltransferase involved in cell wall biosynthesis
MRIVDLSPYGVFPPRSGGHRLVHHTSLALAARHEVFVFAMGLRRGDGLRLRSFVQRPGGRYVEFRHVTPLTFLSWLRRRRTGLPPLRASAMLRWTAPAALRRELARADVVQVESPWQLEFARGAASCPVVLVMQNAEARLLAERGVSRRIAALAARVERAALEQADAVVFLSAEDRAAVTADYGLARAGCHTCGVGVDTEEFRPASEAERAAAKRALGLGGPVAVFAGSWHLPNRSALAAVQGIAAAARGWTFLVVGTVGRPEETTDRVRITGPVDDVRPFFRAADVALNPMREGGGVNLKVLEYLATGLPTVATPFGVRGLDVADVVQVAEIPNFPDALAALADPGERLRQGGAARRVAEARLGWDAVTRIRERILVETIAARARAARVA